MSSNGVSTIPIHIPFTNTFDEFIICSGLHSNTNLKGVLERIHLIIG